MLDSILSTTLVGGTLALILTIVVLAFLSIAFQVWMIVDCAKREFADKTLWLVLLVLGFFMQYGLIVSIIYYFVVKKEDSK